MSLDSSLVGMSPIPLQGMQDVHAVLADPSDPSENIDFLELARDAHAGSTSWYDANVRPSMQSSLNQFYGRHDTKSRFNDDFYKSRSNLFMPKTRSNIRKHEAACAAAYFSTLDVVEINAFNDTDPSEKASADFYKEIMNLRLTSSGPRSIPWFQTLMGAYQDSQVYGVCISFQDWDHANNRPKSELIPPDKFRFDAACNWVNPIESSPFLIWEMSMTVGAVKEKIAKEEFEHVSDEQLSAARRPGTSGVSQARNNGRTDPVQRSSSIKEFDIVEVHLNVIRQKGIDWVYYTLGSGDAYLTLPEPIENVFLHGQRPFVMGKAIIESHKNYPSSIPQLTKDLQSAENTIVNQRLDNVRLAMDKRYLVKAGARVDHDSIRRNSPGSMTLVSNVETDVKVISTPDVNPSSYKEQNLIEIAMDSLAGGFDSGTMQSNRSLNETVGGMTLISQSANQLSEYQLKTFNETWVEPVLRQLLLIEQNYETDGVIMQLAANNAKIIEQYGHKACEDILMKDLNLTVQVGMGATNPATRLEKFTMAMGAVTQFVPNASQIGLDAKEVMKEIFGALGYKDGSRFFASEQVDPQIALLQQQVQQLQQELANKRNPALDAANTELTKAQAFKTRSEATFANIQAAQVIAAMPAVAPVADQVAATNGFVNMQGHDPNYDHGIQASGSLSGSLQNIGKQDPEALIAAHQQANAVNLRKNSDPLMPATGVNGATTGIEGGQQ